MTREEYIRELVEIDIDYHEKALDVAMESGLDAPEFVIDHASKLVFAREVLKYLKEKM